MFLTRYIKSYFSTYVCGEVRIREILKKSFPMASKIVVTDVSGGCGSMYEILVEDKVFQGKKTVMQHRLVNKALKEDIKEMHGLRIVTAVPPRNE